MMSTTRMKMEASLTRERVALRRAQTTAATDREERMRIGFQKIGRTSLLIPILGSIASSEHVPLCSYRCFQPFCKSSPLFLYLQLAAFLVLVLLL